MQGGNALGLHCIKLSFFNAGTILRGTKNCFCLVSKYILLRCMLYCLSKAVLDISLIGGLISRLAEIKTKMKYSSRLLRSV